VRRIALLRPAVDPCRDRIDRRLRQRAVVRELPDGRIGPPRRHAARRDHLPHLRRPADRIVVALEGERRAAAGAVADLAVPLEQRLDRLVEGDRGRGVRRRVAKGGRRREREDEEACRDSLHESGRIAE
jgi:hypothetical protein